MTRKSRPVRVWRVTHHSWATMYFTYEAHARQHALIWGGRVTGGTWTPDPPKPRKAAKGKR